MMESLQPGYGARLAQARQDMGLSPAEVAGKLKLTARQVEAMESEDAVHLPADVFLRGFVRNYARLVGLDPETLVTPMDAEATVSATITAHSEGVAMGSSGVRRWLLVPFAFLLIFVIVVALVYQWLRQGEDALVPEVAEEVAAGVSAAPPTPAVPVEPAPLAGQVEPEQARPAAAAAPLAGTAGTSAAVVASGAEPVVPPRPPDVPPALVAKPLATTPAESASNERVPADAVRTARTHVLRFAAAQDAWIQVVDGKGRRFSKLVRAGGSDSITGEAPFKLVVGEAAQVNMSYDGRAIDLTPFIGQKVARLTLE